MRYLYEYVINTNTGKMKAIRSFFFGKPKFISKYSHERDIYKQSYSQVCLVRRKADDELFICKIIKSSIFNKDELTIPNSIDDKSIIKFLDAYEVFFEGVYQTFLIMEYNPKNEDLFDYILKNNITKEEQFSNIIVDMMKCIQLCHDNNICHGDIKMENYLIDTSTLKLTLIDFGFAFVDSGKGARFNRGTKRYLAPEIERDKFCSKASDIWSMASSVFYIISKIHYTPLLKPSKYKCFSKDLADLLSQCLQVDYTKRPTIEDLLKHPWVLKTLEGDLHPLRNDS